jgi:Xaa-Pro aminopeptidase
MLTECGVTSGSLGIEGSGEQLSAQTRAFLVDAIPNAIFSDASDLIRRVRVIKTPSELAVMRQAAKLTAAGMQAAVERTEMGCRDHDIAAAMYNRLIADGSEYMCAPPVVSAGRLAGVPHSNHRGVLLQQGDSVLLECSGCIHRYNAPLMRAVVLGEPEAIVRRMSDACLAALNAIIEAMAPGKSFHDVAKVGEAAIAQAGSEMLFHHDCGYSVGLGFPPTWADCDLRILLGDETVLEPGMVFHIPMSLRYPGRYGVAVSETVAISETGNEVLTQMERHIFQR